MRYLFSTLLMASTLFAQSYPRPYGQDRALFEQVRRDLDHAAGYPYASRGDLKRFDEARRDLFDFESRFEQGRYEKHELDQAIDRIQRVANSNSLDPRDRGSLVEDLRRMRDYREFRNHHNDYAYGYR